MSDAQTHPGVWPVAAVICLALAACGSTTHHHATTTSAAPLRAFQLATAGTSAAADQSSWQQYGHKPVNRTLTINAVTVYDAGRVPLTLLGIRQAHPAPGLRFRGQLVTLTSGFSRYTEQVSSGAPAGAFGAHANFSPLRGFLLNPDPTADEGASPTVVLTLTATRPGRFHIGDWVISYRVGSARRTLTLADDGEFCAGASGCPAFG